MTAPLTVRMSNHPSLSKSNQAVLKPVRKCGQAQPDDAL